MVRRLPEIQQDRLSLKMLSSGAIRDLKHRRRRGAWMMNKSGRGDLNALRMQGSSPHLVQFFFSSSERVRVLGQRRRLWANQKPEAKIWLLD